MVVELSEENYIWPGLDAIFILEYIVTNHNISTTGIATTEPNNLFLLLVFLAIIV